MQQQARHRLRVLVGGDGIRVSENAERSLIVAERQGAEAHLMAETEVLGIEFGGDRVMFERRLGLEAAQIGLRQQGARLDRLAAIARPVRAAAAARPTGRAR